MTDSYFAKSNRFLSGRQKAALLIHLLKPENNVEILEQLSTEELNILNNTTEAMYSSFNLMDDIAVLEEFQTYCVHKGLLPPNRIVRWNNDTDSPIQKLQKQGMSIDPQDIARLLSQMIKEDS